MDDGQSGVGNGAETRGAAGILRARKGRRGRGHVRRLGVVRGVALSGATSARLPEFCYRLFLIDVKYVGGIMEEGAGDWKVPF